MSDPSRLRAGADRNLLFGILALQMDFITRDALIAAMQAWVLDKAKSLGQILQEQDRLDRDRLLLLDALVHEHVKAHDGDVEQSLASTSLAWIRRALADVDDPSVQAGLATVAITQVEDDPYATRGPSVGKSTSTGQRFRILRPHAEGGLGRVFVARDEELSREVALKEIKDRHADEPQSRARFLLEAEITGGLEHPGIVPVYGLGTYADGRPFYAMRLIRGHSLKDAIECFHQSEAARRDPGERTLELRKLLGRFIDVCETVAYAHSRGVLHRDLKPDNVMLGKYGETLVVDWGLAKTAMDERSEVSKPAEPPEPTLRPASGSGVADTQAGFALGTPAFMSPEQAAGRLGEIGQSSDVYSLGATLYCLLTGMTPVTGADVCELLQKVQAGEITPPRAVNKSVPAALEAVCLKAMALKPAHRYGSTLELATEVEHWLGDEPVTAYAEPWRERLRRWTRRHRTLVTGAAALLVTAVAALALGLVAVNRERQLTEVAGERTTRALAAEEKARQRTRQALDDMTSQVTENWLARQTKLEPVQKEFLAKALASYQEFAAETDDGEEARSGVADAQLRVGRIYHKLGEREAAADAFRRAIDLFARLAADFPAQAKYRKQWAGSHHNWGIMLLETGRPTEALAAYRDALAIRQQLIADFPDEPAYRQDLAVNLNLLANVFSTLGKRKDAESSLRKAVTIQTQLIAGAPAEPKYRRDLAVSESNLGGVLAKQNRFPEAEAAYRDALGLRRELAATFPSVADYRQSTGDTLNSLALLLAKTGRMKEAEEAYREALARQKELADDFPAVASYRHELGLTYQNLGIHLGTSDRPQEAEGAFRDAIALQKQLAVGHPTVPTYRQDLAGAHMNLGVFLYQSGRMKESEQAYRDALDLKKQLAADLPTLPEPRQDVAVAQYNLAVLLKQDRQLEEAESLYREVIALEKQLVAEQPAVPRHRLTLAMACSALGTLMAVDRPEEAEAEYREAIGLHQKLTTDFPTVAQYRQELAVSHHNLGVLLQGAGRALDASAAYNEALAIREKLATDFSNNSHYRFEMALTLNSSAELARDDREFSQARSLIDQAKFQLDAALKANPNGPNYRKTFRRNRGLLVTISAGLGDHETARQTAAELAALGWDAAVDRYDAACSLALCIAVVEAQTGVPEDERRGLAASYAGKAMDWLHQAVAKGYKDVEHMKKDKDLDALRSREDFQKLIAALDAKPN